VLAILIVPLGYSRARGMVQGFLAHKPNPLLRMVLCQGAAGR
jgi:hypothetical protein